MESILWGGSETKRHCFDWRPNWSRHGPGSTGDLQWLNRGEPGNFSGTYPLWGGKGIFYLYSLAVQLEM